MTSPLISISFFKGFKILRTKKQKMLFSNHTDPAVTFSIILYFLKSKNISTNKPTLSSLPSNILPDFNVYITCSDNFILLVFYDATVTSKNLETKHDVNRSEKFNPLLTSQNRIDSNRYINYKVQTKPLPKILCFKGVDHPPLPPYLELINTDHSMPKPFAKEGLKGF